MGGVNIHLILNPPQVYRTTTVYSQGNSFMCTNIAKGHMVCIIFFSNLEEGKGCGHYI